MSRGDVLVRMKADVSNYDANIAKARKQLDSFRQDNLTLGGVLKQTQGSLLATATRFASVTAAVGALGSAFADNIATARKFEVSMSQLSSLTGMVGEDLNKLKEYAIELGSTTTLSASEVADAFKMIGSQQPQLLESGEALKAVTKNAITLAEAAGIDLATASQTLSTSINQMGGDSSNAERYINVLAAASQKGAGDIAWLGEAITKSGTTAKAVGTDYEELVANLEQLAKAGFDASTAGTALRSIIMNLEKQTNNDFKPSIVGLTQAFENLGEANLSIVGYQEIAGKMFASQAKALADAAGEAKNMTAAITGTNTAEEQAKTNTDNLDGSLKSLASAWEGLNLHINSSNGFLRDCVDWLKYLVVWADKAFTEAGKLKGVLSGLNGEEGSGNTKVDQQLKKLKVIKAGGGSDYIFNATLGGMVEDYNRQIIALDAQIKNGGKPVGGGSGSSQDIRYLQRQMEALKIMRDQLQSGAKDILNPAAVISSVVSGSGGSSKSTKNLPEYADFSKLLFKNGSQDLQAEAPFTSVFSMLKDKSEFDPENILGSKSAWESYKDTITETVGSARESFNNLTTFTKDFKPFVDEQNEMTAAAKQNQMAMGLASQAVNAFGSALAGMEDPGAKAAGMVVSAIASIALGFAQAAAAKDTVASGWAWLVWVAAGLSAMATSISLVHNLTGFAEGGIVGGNQYSGDNIYGGGAMVNSGELVLNKAQQGNLASQLSGNGMQGIKVTGKIKGTDIILSVDRSLQLQGKQLLTWG